MPRICLMKWLLDYERCHSSSQNSSLPTQPRRVSLLLGASRLILYKQNIEREMGFCQYPGGSVFIFARGSQSPQFGIVDIVGHSLQCSKGRPEETCWKSDTKMNRMHMRGVQDAVRKPTD